MFATASPTRPDSLNADQRRAVGFRGGHLLVVAGAGTGKTKTLVARVVDLIEDGADPSRMLLLTFTRRSAAEMLGRVAAATPDGAAAQVWGGTFHSVANRLLRMFGASAGLPPDFTVLDHGDSTDLMGMVRTEAGLGERAKRFPRKETIAGIYSRMVNGQAKLADVLEVDYPWCTNHAEDLKSIFAAYTSAKRSHHVLDFDDLLLFWRGLTASRVGRAMAGLFDHILVDEYQDTNPIQSDILRGMCRTQPAEDADGTRRPPTQMCAVGDDAQAIYGFRSASVANMWAYSTHFPGAEVLTLEQNYRSTEPILAVANAVLDGGTNRADDRHFAKKLWTTRTQGPAPVLATHHDEGAQARFVADAVLDARERGVDLRQQAVLFRSGHHGDVLELELTRRDIPYVKFGGLKYLEAAHIKDLLALLRIAENPADTLAWHRVLATMDGVGPATIRRVMLELGLSEEVVDPADPTAAVAGMAVADNNPARGDALTRLVGGDATFPAPAAEQAAELRSALGDCTGDGLSPAEQVERLAAFCALVFPHRYENSQARLADLSALAATAAGYRSRSRFLAELTLDPPGKTSDRAGPPHLDDDWLTLSTIHSAKGGEWRAVHLLHASDGSLPSDMAAGSQDGLDEELRLMYVALTRAQEELAVHVPLRYHVNRHGLDDRHVYAQPSRFIEPARHLFDERASTGQRSLDQTVEVEGAVGVGEEVDTLLASLWE
ncbi:MAG: ATP-dependent helicase [Microthrixaceae bacterium]